MKLASTLAGLVFIALAGGCASTSSQPQAGVGQTKRVIRCSINPDADPATVLNASSAFAELPQVLEVFAGAEPKDAPATANPAGEVVTFILTFRDERSLTNTVNNPAFQRIQNEQLRPLCRDVTAFDTTVRQYQVAETFAAETEAATLQRRAAAIDQQNELRSRTK